jgi:hypothetical protein
MYVMGQTHLFAIGANAVPVAVDAPKKDEVQIKN